MITLAEYQNNYPEKWVDNMIIDEFRVNSILMDSLEYDDTVVPNGGNSFTYAYDRVTVPATAAFRTVGGTYTPSDAKATKQVAEVKILGGKFTMDRAIAKASEDGFYDQAIFQMQQKVKATVATFQNAIINGDNTKAGEFDGLDKMLTGSDTEFTSTVDLSTSALIDKNATAFIDEVDGVIAEMDGEPQFILGNSKSIAKFKAVARRVSQYQETKDDIGRTISKYGNAILLDLGSVPGSNSPIIGIDGTAGKTDLYFVRLGRDGFHGITLKDNLIDTVLPKYGEVASESINGLVEMYAGVVLKKTKAAAVLRGIKVK